MKHRDLQGVLSGSRTFLMGAAMAWIVLAHLFAHLELPQGGVAAALYGCIADGYGGCDIFLFLSGFGLAHSLKGDPSPRNFLKRRARKLLPSYYPFILLYLAIMAATSGITAWEVFGDLTFTGFWFHWRHQFNWYIQALPAFYLLALLSGRVLEKLGSPRAAAALGAGYLALLAVSFGRYQMVAVTRIPVFLLGFFLARWEKAVPWGRGTVLLSAAALILGVAVLRLTAPVTTWENGLYWYPFLLIAPALCVLLTWLRPCLPKAVDRFFCLFGKCSLEIYLIHDLAMEWLFQDMTGNTNWFALAAISCGLGIGYHHLVNVCRNKWTGAAR